MADHQSIWDVMRASDDPADALANAIFTGAWFPPRDDDPDELDGGGAR